MPSADRVTLGQLAQMTSGYADYVADADFLAQLNIDPFRQWSPEELVAYGISQPLIYEPGTNWNYSHTNYVLLGVPAGTWFIEESTSWNPSWTITRGAIQYTDIVDMTRTAQAIGTGELLSPAMHAEQLNLDTRGRSSTIDGCATCFPHSEIYTYGIGVVMMGDWILQNPMFNGTAAVEAYLPSEDISLAVVVTFDEKAFDENGEVPNLATNLFRELAGVVAPGHSPPTR